MLTLPRVPAAAQQPVQGVKAGVHHESGGVAMVTTITMTVSTSGSSESSPWSFSKQEERGRRTRTPSASAKASSPRGAIRVGGWVEGETWLAVLAGAHTHTSILPPHPYPAASRDVCDRARSDFPSSGALSRFVSTARARLVCSGCCALAAAGCSLSASSPCAKTKPRLIGAHAALIIALVELIGPLYRWK